MLFRRDGDDVIAIAQPSHAWLSGQLVRTWGNEAFPAPAPHEEVCLGAEQHDIGWLDWEAAPTLNPATGLPHAFHELGPDVHTGLWTRGVRLALAFGLYPALLVSLHADTIYGRYFDFAKASPEDARLVRDFLDGQHAFQRDAARQLAAQPRYAEGAKPATIERNRLLVGAADHLSLRICGGVTEAARVPDAPGAGAERIELWLRARNGRADDLVLEPWPFAADRIELLCEGRPLRGRFSDEAAMRAALAAAAPSTLAVTLRPG